MAPKGQLKNSKKVVKLWVHEIARVFGDRLIAEEDQKSLYDHLFKASRDKIKEDLHVALKELLDERHLSVDNKEVMTRHVQFGDILSEGIGTHDRQYDEVAPGPKLQDKV